MADRTRLHAELAWLGGGTVAGDVLIDMADGVITGITPGVASSGGARRLPGLTIPGLVNAHSHVFHRAIRGHSQSGAGDFWSWRNLMYAVAARLDPDTLYALARATYAEMALAGITTVGEFHYLHHDRDGTPYGDPNAMGAAVVRAANDAGLRITLLDTCYLQGDVSGAPLDGVQRRFGDGSWEQWARRLELLADTPMLRVGGAIHSVRAVPRAALAPTVAHARRRGMPLHVHVSEQPAENAACLDVHGLTPTGLLAAEGVLGPTTTAVHATHLTDADVTLLADSRTAICMCPTTERDLGDGVGPAVRLRRAGSPLCIGSDAHAMIDLFEEARAVELDERLVSGRRGHLRAAELLTAATSAGAASLGWDAGRIEPGAPADLVTVDLDSPRTAGARAGDPLAQTVFAATATDVSTVIVGGRSVVDAGEHARVRDVGAELDAAIGALLTG